MIDIYREIVQIQEQGRQPPWHHYPHPRLHAPQAGSQMLVRQDGSSRGTISGGRIEAEVTERARQSLKTGRPQLYVARLSEEQAGALGLLCGGRSGSGSNESDFFLPVSIFPPSKSLSVKFRVSRWHPFGYDTRKFKRK